MKKHDMDSFVAAWKSTGTKEQCRAGDWYHHEECVEEGLSSSGHGILNSPECIVTPTNADLPAYITKSYKTWAHTEPMRAIHDGYHFLSGLELFAPGVKVRGGYPAEAIGTDPEKQIRRYVEKYIPGLTLHKRDLEHCSDFMSKHQRWSFINVPHPCLGVTHYSNNK